MGRRFGPVLAASSDDLIRDTPSQAPRPRHHRDGSTGSVMSTTTTSKLPTETPRVTAMNSLAATSTSRRASWSSRRLTWHGEPALTANHCSAACQTPGYQLDP